MNEISIDWYLLGSKLATLSANEQAKFFTGFCKEFDKFDTHCLKETQMLYINDILSEYTKSFMKEYFVGMWYEE